MKKIICLTFVAIGLALPIEANPLAKVGHAVAHVFKKISHGIGAGLKQIQFPTER